MSQNLHITGNAAIPPLRVDTPPSKGTPPQPNHQSKSSLLMPPDHKQGRRGAERQPKPKGRLLPIHLLKNHNQLSPMYLVKLPRAYTKARPMPLAVPLTEWAHALQHPKLPPKPVYFSFQSTSLHWRLNCNARTTALPLIQRTGLVTDYKELAANSKTGALWQKANINEISPVPRLQTGQTGQTPRILSSDANCQLTSNQTTFVPWYLAALKKQACSVFGGLAAIQLEAKLGDNQL